MPIILKEILITDTDSQKLDKINYNFDQIIANGGGPMGVQGAKGDTGLQGLSGIAGFQGYQGPTGPAGDSGVGGETYWNLIDTGIINTLVPVHDPGSEYAPSLSIGYIEGQTGYDESNGDSIFKINRKASQFSHNIQLTEDSSTFYGHITVEKNTSTGLEKMTIGLNSLTENEINFYANKYIFKNPTDDTDLITFDKDANSANFNVDTTFNNDVTFEAGFTIESGTPDTNKIATAADSTGQVIWKTATEIGATVPIGTIISILPEIFEANFNNSLNGVDGSSVLNIEAGAGTGDYLGWYLCNGQTWKDGLVTEYLVPNLNTFTYTIQSNGTDQYDVNVTDTNPKLTGGADITFNASYSSGTYTITQSVQTDSLEIGTAAGTSLDIIKLPQIIYLGVENLYWQNAGSEATSTTISITRISAPTSNMFSITPSTPATGITYEYATGYTFDIVLTAANNYGWDNVNDVTLTSSETFTINSRQFTGTSAGFGYDERQLTLNVTLSGLSIGGTTSVSYSLSGNPVLVVEPVVLPTTPTPSVTISSWDGNQINISASWAAAAGYDNNTMKYVIDTYFSTTSITDPSTISSWSSWDTIDANTKTGNVGAFQSSPTQIYAYVRLRINETGTSNYSSATYAGAGPYPYANP